MHLFILFQRFGVMVVPWPPPAPRPRSIQDWDGGWVENGYLSGACPDVVAVCPVQLINLNSKPYTAPRRQVHTVEAGECRLPWTAKLPHWGEQKTVDRSAAEKAGEESGRDEEGLRSRQKYTAAARDREERQAQGNVPEAQDTPAMVVELQALSAYVEGCSQHRGHQRPRRREGRFRAGAHASVGLMGDERITNRMEREVSSTQSYLNMRVVGLERAGATEDDVRN